MNNALLISIIIPTYNRVHLIKETLDSIIAQKHKNWECIIVDDGSSDITQKVVNEYCEKDQRFFFSKRPKNKLKGANACRNFGFEKAKGEYIQWFDSDDIMHPDLLKLQLQNLQNTEKLISFCNFCFFRNTNEINNAVAFNTFEGIASVQQLLTKYVSGSIVLNTQTVLYHRSMVDSIKFNEKLHRAQDLDFIFRAFLNNTKEIEILNLNLVYIRRHEHSITDNFKNRNLKLIESEIVVREMIWQELVSHKFPNESVQGAIKMYLQSLKYLLYAKKYSLFYRKMGKTFISVNVKWKFRVIKLSLLAMVYVFTKKGLTSYQKVLNQLRE